MDLSYTNVKYLSTPEFYHLNKLKSNLNRDLISLISNKSQIIKKHGQNNSIQEIDAYSQRKLETRKNSQRDNVILPKINPVYLDKKKSVSSFLTEFKDVPIYTSRCQDIKSKYKKQLQAVLKDTVNKSEQIEQLQASKKIYSQYSQYNVSKSLLAKKNNKSKSSIYNKQYNSKSLEEFHMDKIKLFNKEQYGLLKISKPVIKSTYEDVQIDDTSYTSLHKLASDIKEGLTILPNTPLSRKFYSSSEYRLNLVNHDNKFDPPSNIRLFPHPEESEDERENKVNFDNIPNLDEYIRYTAFK